MLNPIILEVDSISIFSGISCLQGGSPIVFRYTFGAFVKVSCSMSIFLNVSNNFSNYGFWVKALQLKWHIAREIFLIKQSKELEKSSVPVLISWPLSTRS